MIQSFLCIRWRLLFRMYRRARQNYNPVTAWLMARVFEKATRPAKDVANNSIICTYGKIR